MAKGYEVLRMLRPEGGWVIVGDEYENIQFSNCEPISKKDYEKAFSEYDIWVETKEKEKLKNKKELLERLGITEDEAKLLLE